MLRGCRSRAHYRKRERERGGERGQSAEGRTLFSSAGRKPRPDVKASAVVAEAAAVLQQDEKNAAALESTQRGA